MQAPPQNHLLTHRKEEAALKVGGDLGFRLTGLRVDVLPDVRAAAGCGGVPAVAVDVEVALVAESYGISAEERLPTRVVRNRS